jgi:4-amino-4-deoxy-L-arabinose transferase-like glycosyltransferase
MSLKPGDNKTEKYGARIALLLIIAAAAYLRFAELGVPSFWVDELNFVYAGKSLLHGEEPRLPSGNLNQRAMLYAHSVALSFRCLGVNEFAARFPSAVFGILAVLAIYLIAKDLFGRGVGVLSAFLLTFSHLAIGWSRLARMYTLFQLLFMIGAYAFYKGFEGKAVSCEAGARPSFGKKLKCYVAEQGLCWPWLILGAFVFWLSFQVHELTGIFAASVLAFIAGSFLFKLMNGEKAGALRSKYGLSLAAALLLAVFGFAFFDLAAFVQRAVSFHPSWAKYAYVQDTHYYYYLLTESSQFPLAAFFLIGGIQMITRVDKKAFYLACNFVAPVLLHSFAFSYKIPNYIFQVYPFFAVLAAYAMVNLYRGEAEKIFLRRREAKPALLRRMKKAVLLLAVFGWLPLTLWFRYALKLPFMGSAGHNGAVDYEDWRGAAEFVKADTTHPQILASTLPLTLLYYAGRAEYGLNLAHTDEALDWREPALNNGKRRDYYSGAEAITNFDELQRMLAQHRAALFVVDTYRFEHSQYVPTEIAQFVKSNMTRVWEDGKKTVQVFRWERK